jgi:hypothetical protein
VHDPQGPSETARLGDGVLDDYRLVVGDTDDDRRRLVGHGVS